MIDFYYKGHHKHAQIQNKKYIGGNITKKALGKENFAIDSQWFIRYSAQLQLS